MATMEITYALTHRDVFDSTIAIRNRKKWAKWVFRLSLPVLGLTIVFRFLASSGSQLVSQLAPLLLLSLLWVFLLWGSPWWFARTQFRQPSSQGERTASFDDNEVKWWWNGGSSATEWKTYVRWMESRNLILLCSSPIQCAIVPKRALNAEQLSHLRALLTQKLGAGLRV
jgi:hypothetical protein